MTNSLSLAGPVYDSFTGDLGKRIRIACDDAEYLRVQRGRNCALPWCGQTVCSFEQVALKLIDKLIDYISFSENFQTFWQRVDVRYWFATPVASGYPGWLDHVVLSIEI